MVRVKRSLAAATRALAVAAAALSVPAPCRTAEIRQADPVIVKASKVPFLHGLRITGFRAFAFKNGAAGPIPFQIDEVTIDKNGNGEVFVFTRGQRNRKPNQGRLAELDEIVFMCKDTGEKAAVENFPYRFDRGAEIEVADPLTGAKSYAYLVHSADPENLPASDTDYVQVVGTPGWTAGEYYKVGQSSLEKARKFPNIVDYFAIRTEAGGNGADVLDRVKFRSRVEALGGTLRFSRNEDSFRIEELASLDGPVRRITRSRNSVYLALGITTPPQSYNVTSYFNGYVTPVYIDIPIDLTTIKGVVRTAYFRSTLDFNKNAVGMKYYNPHHTKGILVDGVPSAEEKKIHNEEFEWMLLAGEKQGAWMMYLVKPPPDQFPLRLNNYLVDDVNSPDPPEEEPGQIGNMGFTVANILDAKAGTHKILVYVYFPPYYKPGDEKAYLNIHKHPLQTSAREFFFPGTQ
ncbi:MAG: hypothetical protein AB1742_12395 [bacterium]